MQFLEHRPHKPLDVAAVVRRVGWTKIVLDSIEFQRPPERFRPELFRIIRLNSFHNSLDSPFLLRINNPSGMALTRSVIAHVDGAFNPRFAQTAAISRCRSLM